ncbi:MAG: rod shape-determining protein MreC [Oscillibacter sp.]|nr:rod shape-determining protein MreC [Oscillibacter sp.]
MRDFFEKNGLWILFAGAVIAAALALLSFFGGVSPLVNLMNTVASPFRAAYSSVAERLEARRNHYEDVTALKEENEALKRQLAQMEETVRRAEADSEENAFLRALLGLREQRRDLTDFETATVTEHSVTNWTASLTLNKGTLHGVETGDCVIDGNGALVGQISEAGLNWSTVLTLADTDTSIGARVFRSKDLAIASGDFSLMNEGLLRLDHLPAAAQLIVGDLVVTSGLGGFLPSDLVIGTVESVQADDSDTASYGVIRPAADFGALTEVCVIKSFEIVD